MPEAAMDEDYLAQAREDEVGGAREGFDVEAIAVAEGMDEAADDQLGGSVLGFDQGHDAGAFGFAEGVSHVPNLGTP
jgi:hypothetical protein